MWAKIYGTINHHPKITAAGPVAAWYYVCGLTYASTYGTDGFIPVSNALRLTPIDDPEAAIARLVAVGLWHKCTGGYQIHDFLEYQEPAAHMKASREANRRRQAEFRRRNGDNNGKSNALRNADNNGTSNALRNALVTGIELESELESESLNALPPLPPTASPAAAPEAREPDRRTLRRVPKPAEVERAAIDAHPLTAPLVEQFGPVTSRELDGWRDDLAALDEMGARPEDIPRAAVGYAAIMGSDHTGRPIRMTRKALVQHWYSSLHAPLTPTRSPTDGRMPVHGELDPNKYLTGQYARFFNRAHDEDDAYDDIGEASP